MRGSPHPDPLPRAAEGLAVRAEAHVDATAAQRVDKRAHRRARIEMAFAGEEKTFAKAPGEVRLERGDARFFHALMAGSARGEALDLADVARRRDDQRARPHDAGDPRVPPVDRAQAKLDHARRRAFALAERRQHAAGKPRSVAAELARPLDQRNRRAALGEGQRGR